MWATFNARPEVLYQVWKESTRKDGHTTCCTTSCTTSVSTSCPQGTRSCHADTTSFCAPSTSGSHAGTTSLCAPTASGSHAGTATLCASTTSSCHADTAAIYAPSGSGGQCIQLFSPGFRHSSQQSAGFMDGILLEHASTEASLPHLIADKHQELLHPREQARIRMVPPAGAHHRLHHYLVLLPSD